MADAIATYKFRECVRETLRPLGFYIKRMYVEMSGQAPMQWAEIKSLDINMCVEGIIDMLTGTGSVMSTVTETSHAWLKLLVKLEACTKDLFILDDVRAKCSAAITKLRRARVTLFEDIIRKPV